MVVKTATYSGMNLKGELRESISLDDDDLSDVEDEVFIRDGKNGYKLAEELNVKRPLMAPRRKQGKHLKPRPSCRAWCKPCCYVFTSLSVLIGLIVLVVVLVSIYPVPLDKLRDWIVSKSKTSRDVKGHLPCTSLKVSEVWAVNLPALTTESPVRALDIDGDGIEDALFGFGTGDNYNLFTPDIFCPIFLGVPAPCEGGLIALNGRNGKVIWKRWLNDTIFGLHCNADINLDGISDCLAVGVGGTIMVIDSKSGSDIWRLNPGKMNVFVANFVQDQNNDNVSDVITSHSSLEDRTLGHVLILSGKTGQELKRVDTAKTFFMPQLLKQNGTSTLMLFGTGTPNTAGNLSAIGLNNFDNLANQSTTLYQDKFKGILTQTILVDITGDNIPDIVASMYNSTIVAINGKAFENIWNYTIPNALTDMSPTPAYFNCDNVTDFLVVYQKYDPIFNYNYTQMLIIDGFTGQPIYQPISGGIVTQMSGLTLSMEGKGHDIYLFWTSECSNTEASQVDDVSKKTGEHSKVHDECKRQFNSTTILKLNGLNEYHQPPGITIYNSDANALFEYKDTKSAIKILKDYLETHPMNLGQEETMSKIYNGDPGIGITKYGKSSFRHKDKPNDIVKNFNVPQENDNNLPNAPISEDYNIWMPDQDELEFSNYNLADDNIPYNQKQMLFDEVANPKTDDNNRDPRSRQEEKAASKKKNLADKIYGYRNLRLAKKRLLRDDESLPTDIIKDTYFKNEENRLRKNKLEQRDVNSHHLMNIDKILEEQKREAELNRSTTLWDIETENELGERDKQLGYFRRKRQIAWGGGVSKVTSVGAVLDAFNSTNSSIDVIFVKYWQPLDVNLQDLMARDIEECVGNAKTSKEKCQEEQDKLRRNFANFEQLAQLKLGQMTVYRARIQCKCDSSYDKEIEEKCVSFLPKNLQGWPEYLGKNGDGIFTR